MEQRKNKDKGNINASTIELRDFRGQKVYVHTINKELAAQRQQELAETGHSNIDPTRDAKIRHQFNFQRRKRFISIPDFEKYFFSKEVQFPHSTQK